MTLGPSEVLTKENVKVRWGERYTSDALNKKFLGIPRGVYLGFAPSAVGLTLNLITDRSVTITNASTTPFVISDIITGGTSGTSAAVRAISSGYLLLDTPSGGTGSFIAGETITGAPSGATATVGAYTTEAISFARVTSSTPLVPGRSEDVVDLVTGDTVTLDFTGFTNGTYYIYATGAYAVGSVTTGTIASRTAPPPNGTSEVLICIVVKGTSTLTIQATAPTSRQEPFATAGSRIGFMPGGSIDALAAAQITTQEVQATRVDTAGTTAPVFDPSAPQITGVPSRMTSDLARAAMATRLGKRIVVVQGNTIDPTVVTPISSVGHTGTANPVFNISGAFSARVRDNLPFRDGTNGIIPGQTLNFASITGTFTVGETVTGSNGTTGIVQSVGALAITVYDIIGHGFNPHETVTGGSSAATGAITTVSGGVRIPVVIEPTGSDVITLTLSGIFGAFSLGSVVTGSTSSAQGVVRAAVGSTVDLDQIFGVFRKGEIVTAAGPANGTITAIDQRLGAITGYGNGAGGDVVRNIVNVYETQTGRKPVDANGHPFYGRLLFGPNGAASAGGGGAGELLVASAATQQINFTNGSTTVTNNNLDFTQYCLPGDILEGADGRFYEISPVAGSVTSATITLTSGKPYLGPNASAGFNVGPGPRRRRRYLLELVTLSGGAEASATLTVGTNIPVGASIRPFFPVWFNEEQSNVDATLLKEAPGEGVITATQLVPGIGIVPTQGSAAPAAPAPVFGTIQNFQNGGTNLAGGNFHTINFAAGGATISNGIVTIPAIAGPTGPSGGGGGSGPTGPTGPAGPGFTHMTNPAIGPSTNPVTSTGSSSISVDVSTQVPAPIKMFAVTSSWDFPGGGGIDRAYVSGAPSVSGTTVSIPYTGNPVDLVMDAALWLWVTAAS